MNDRIAPHLSRVLLVAATMASAGCSNRLAHAEAGSLPLSSELPSVTLVSSSSELASAPSGLTSSIRVGDHGDVLMATMHGEPGILRVADSTGHLVTTFGRKGEGPGEARGPAPLAVRDSGVLAFDTHTLRLSEWDRSGHILGMLTSDVPVYPIAEAPDGRWLAAGNSRNMAPLELDPRTLESRRLIPESDSFYHALRPAPNDPHSQLPPVLGVWSQGFIVANGATYQLGLYDWSGRLRHVLSRTLQANQPTEHSITTAVNQVRSSRDPNGRMRSEAELDRIASHARHESRDWFSHVSPLGLDDHGRIWVAGPEGDSAYVDAFNAERFLGRIHLPCRDFANRWSMKGQWLALVCAPDDEAFDGDAVVKLFRLDERGVTLARNPVLP